MSTGPSPADTIIPEDYHAKFSVRDPQLCCDATAWQGRLQNRTTYSKYTEWVHPNDTFVMMLDVRPISPCAKAAKASGMCMDQNDYDRDKCQDFFQAYRDCKRAWVSLVFSALVWNFWVFLCMWYRSSNSGGMIGRQGELLPSERCWRGQSDHLSMVVE